jgi:diguanylate cyclase (GGDEF)-like protein
MGQVEHTQLLGPAELGLLTREQLVEAVSQLQSQLAAAREQLDQEKITDSLTRLANRDYFFAALTRLCYRARRFGQMVCLGLVDVDGFRLINERHGHLAGDLVLSNVADLLRKVVRDYDLLARFGEDTFVFAVDNGDPKLAARLAERVRAAVAGNPFCFEDHVLPVTVTAGVICARVDQLTDRPDLLVHAAFEAVAAARSKGPGQSCCRELTTLQPTG